MHLITVLHLQNKPRLLEDHALQVANILMLANSTEIVLTEFIRNLKAHVFALVQTPPFIEAEEYNLPKKGKAEK